MLSSKFTLPANNSLNLTTAFGEMRRLVQRISTANQETGNALGS
jgi:hypothetical protein